MTTRQLETLERRVMDAALGALGRGDRELAGELVDLHERVVDRMIDRELDAALTGQPMEAWRGTDLRAGATEDYVQGLTDRQVFEDAMDAVFEHGLADEPLPRQHSAPTWFGCGVIPSAQDYF